MQRSEVERRFSGQATETRLRRDMWENEDFSCSVIPLSWIVANDARFTGNMGEGRNWDYLHQLGEHYDCLVSQVGTDVHFDSFI